MLELNSLRQSLRTQYATDSLAEVASVVGRLEANQVCTKHTVQKLVPHAETAENLGRWECDVHKESDGDARQLRPEHGRKEHEVVVVNPDDVAFLVLAHDRVREPLVD